MQAHDVREIADQLRYAEDHVGAVAVLVALAIDFEPHAQRMRVGDLVLRDEPGTERTESVAALSLVPRAAALELQFPLRYVVNHAIARNVRRRVGLGDVAGKPADHDAELDLPVRLLRATRNLDVVVRTDDGAGPFPEHHGLRGYRQVRLCRMVRKIQADADELADPAHARADSYACGRER